MDNSGALGTVYYLTADPANGERARELAAGVGVALEVLFPKELPLPADAAALAVDLDNLCLDAHGRRSWLAALRDNPPGVPTFVHGYDFDDEGADAGGVVLARRADELRRWLAVWPKASPKKAA